MADPALSSLLQRLFDIYGEARITPYGVGSFVDRTINFRIVGVPATFSVLVGPEYDLKACEYDVQIEGRPPGDYVFADVVTLDGVLELVRRVCGPPDGWP